MFLWWDLRDEPRDTRLAGTALGCFFAAGYSGPLGSSGDTNSLVGVCCVILALGGSHAARRGQRWGGPVLLLGLTLALYTHAAFAIYAGIFLLIEAAYFRDWRAVGRLALASALAAVASLPTHWESLRYPEYVSFNNTVYDPGGRRTGPAWRAPSTTTPRCCVSRSGGSTTTAASTTSGCRSSSWPPCCPGARVRATTRGWR